MLFRKSKAPSPPPANPPQRDIPVAIPARYVLRLDHAQFWLGLGLSLFLVLVLPAVFWDSRDAEGEFWGVAALLGLILLMSAGLLAQYFLASITVDREGLSLHWWPRRRREASFGDIAWVQAKKSDLIFRNEAGKKLFTVNINLRGSVTLLEDLADRDLPLSDKKSPPPAQSRQVPDRLGSITLPDPGQVPETFTVRYAGNALPGLLMFLVLLAGAVWLFFLDGPMVVSAGLFVLYPIAALILYFLWVLVRNRRVLLEVSPCRLRYRSWRGEVTELSLSQLAPAEVEATPTVFGTALTLVLRRRDGSLFCRIPDGMENSQLLALFLADSGLSFTYPPA